MAEQNDVGWLQSKMSSGAARHIDIKFYVVKEKIEDHTISLKHIRTKKIESASRPLSGFW